MGRILITGGAGFVGSNLSAELLSKDEEVVVLDSLVRNGANENLAWLRTLGLKQFVHGDVRDVMTVQQVIEETKPTAVFHLAGQVAMTTSVAKPLLDFETNVLGSINVLEAVRKFSPLTTVVYASSNKIYGNLTHLDLIEEPTRYKPRVLLGVGEDAALEFHTPYGCSKGAADQYMLDYARTFGLKTVVFRHSTIYGGRQFADFDQGWVGWFCRQALETKRDPARAAFTIAGDGKQVRDLLHVSDAVSAYLAAVRCIDRAQGQAFNIGGGAENSMSLLELFAFLEERLGVKLRFEKLPWRLSDQRYFVADYAKAGRLLRWEPKVGRAEGLADALRWEGAPLPFSLKTAADWT